MSSERIKVTDKRRFAPDGTLREGFEVETAARPEEDPSPEPSRPASSEPPPREPASQDPPAGPAEPAEQEGRGFAEAGFLDLVRMLAEPASIYLGDLPLPDGRSAEDLDMARIHIDLLEVLRRKSSGNLSFEEQSVLDDVLYRLRLRYVEKRR